MLFSLILNLVFHHALMLIPQMEIPGEVPPGYILRHPVTEKVEVYKLVMSAVMVSYISLLHTVSQNLQVRCRVLVGGWGGGVFNSSLKILGSFFTT